MVHGHGRVETEDLTAWADERGAVLELGKLCIENRLDNFIEEVACDNKCGHEIWHLSDDASPVLREIRHYSTMLIQCTRYTM